MNESHEQPVLSRPEAMEMGFGLCTLAALMWLLWLNGFNEIQPDQVSLRYFREIILVLILGQFAGIIGVLRTPDLPRSARNPRWVEFGLGIALLVMAVGLFSHVSFLSAIEVQNLFRFLCLCYGIAPLWHVKEYFFRLARRNRWSHMPHMRPALVFLLTLVGVILLGGTLLLSPGATKDGVALSVTDAYFLSTSAVCVTGLVPVNIHEQFTNYGQTVLLVLFQLGAFGVMTFAYFVSIMVGQGLSLRSKVTISNLLDEDGLAQVDRFIKNIIAVTFGLEFLGAIALYIAWQGLPGIEGDTLWWYAVFHSVSGFCNAGFTLFADNLATPMIAGNFGGQFIIMMLILCGSLGFAMYLEMVRKARIALGWDPKTHSRSLWSTYSYIVIRMTAVLVLGGGACLFLIKVIDGSLWSGQEPWYWILWESLFNASARTAGFNISNVAASSLPYALFLSMLMFIGGNPGSTTGGVHTTTFAVSCGEIARILRGQRDVVIHYRRVARSVVERSMITVILAGAWVGAMTMVMCFIEPHIELHRLFFEVVSSFATVGFSLGVTPELGTAGKWIIVLNMVVGRVGMVSFILAFMRAVTPAPVRYPEIKLPLS